MSDSENKGNPEAMKRLSAIIAALALAGALLPGAASALTFTPPTFDFTANPGDSLSDVVRLHNESSEPVTLRAEAVNFSGKEGDETSGTPEFYASDAVRNGRELAPWISFINTELTLQPGERGGIHFDIKVPADAGPGSYFGAVTVTSLAPQAQQGVGVVGTTAVLILLKVNGDVVEEAALTAFTAAPRVAAALPIRFEARVENKGTTHLKPNGDVRIRDAFGKVVAVIPINRLEYKSVLPESARRYSAEWKDGFAFGPYAAELEMKYGVQQRLLKSTARFWVVPVAPLVGAVGGLAALILAITAFLRWYKRRIIAQMEKAEQD